MAMAGYGYVPSVQRSKAIREIESDLRLNGLSVDAKTIRRYLKEAKSYFPDDDNGNKSG